MDQEELGLDLREEEGEALTFLSPTGVLNK